MPGVETGAGVGCQLKAGCGLVGVADVAQLVEHTLGKGEVTGSIPVVSSEVVVERRGCVMGAWSPAPLLKIAAEVGWGALVTFRASRFFSFR